LEYQYPIILFNKKQLLTAYVIDKLVESGLVSSWIEYDILENKKFISALNEANALLIATNNKETTTNTEKKANIITIKENIKKIEIYKNEIVDYKSRMDYLLSSGEFLAEIAELRSEITDEAELLNDGIFSQKERLSIKNWEITVDIIKKYFEKKTKEVWVFPFSIFGRMIDKSKFISNKKLKILSNLMSGEDGLLVGNDLGIVGVGNSV